MKCMKKRAFAPEYKLMHVQPVFRSGKRWYNYYSVHGRLLWEGLGNGALSWNYTRLSRSSLLTFNIIERCLQMDTTKSICKLHPSFVPSFWSEHSNPRRMAHICLCRDCISWRQEDDRSRTRRSRQTRKQYSTNRPHRLKLTDLGITSQQQTNLKHRWRPQQSTNN